MKLYVIRHGQTEDNQKGLIMGQRNSSLTALGVRQSNQKAAKLASIQLDAIYSSDLERCVDTAKIIQLVMDKATPLTTSALLREISFGVYEGRPYSEMSGIKIHNMQQAFKRGESSGQMIERVVRYINEIYVSHQNGTVLIVTHSGPAAVIESCISSAGFFQALNDGIGFLEIREYIIRQPLDSEIRV